MIRPPPRSTLCPYTTLFRSVIKRDSSREYFDKSKIINGLVKACQKRPVSREQIDSIADEIEKKMSNDMLTEVDRKSTRLNSSHANISYAVFCLKKHYQQGTV